MAYNYWKMMDKVAVAIKTNKDTSYYGRTFNAFVTDASDEKGLETAKDWARERSWNREKQEYDKVYEPEVHVFDNEGFSVKILKSAGGSSQGGRLSFLACEIEKDGVKFVIGVNDALLVDLIRHSDIHNGQIKQKVMFVRKGGQPGFIHEGMEAYQEAQADMKAKADLKKAKKTSKWEIGGIYSTLTQRDVCLGEVWDHYEEVPDPDNHSWYYRNRTKLVKRDKPVKVLAWKRIYNFRGEDEIPKDFESMIKEEIKDRDYIWFDAGKPPARAKSHQLEVKESDMPLLDKMLALKQDGDYGKYFKGRYTRLP